MFGVVAMNPFLKHIFKSVKTLNSLDEVGGKELKKFSLNCVNMKLNL